MGAGPISEAGGWLLLVGLVAFSLVALPPASAQTPADLAADQADLARKFERLEALAKRIAELTEAEDPARAEQLRSAIRKSQELELPERFDAVVGLLQAEQLAAASQDQSALANQLQLLLRLLLADPQQAKDEAERKRLKEVLKELDRHIRLQQQLRSASLGEADAERLAERQESLADEVDETGEKLSPSDAKQEPDSAQPQQDSAQPQQGGDAEQSPSGEPSESSPAQQSSGESPQGETPQQRAAERIKAARQKMQEATEDLRESKRDAAEQRQAEAQLRLEDARQEIEEALRQLREEEMQRRLAALATRLRRMLSEQIDVRDLTKQTEEDRPNRGRRATAIAAAGLANREEELIATADGALRLLQEDGKSIAYPEVIEQVRDDMRSIAGRLRKADLGAVTLRLEEEVISSLEEAIDSIDRTLEDLKQRQQQGQQGQQGGEPGEPPVVDKLAELRMIRAIQARILRRTKFWDDLRQAGEVDPAEAQQSLDRLSDRQTRLMRAMRNVGKPLGQ